MAAGRAADAEAPLKRAVELDPKSNVAQRGGKARHRRVEVPLRHELQDYLQIEFTCQHVAATGQCLNNYVAA